MLLRLLLRLAIILQVAVSAEQLRKIFTDDEVKHCKSEFGGPNFFISGAGNVHVVTNCAKRVPPSDSFLSYDPRGLRDIVTDATCVMKSSADGGVSWSNFQTLSPKGKTSYASCKGMYDVKRNRVVVQYTYVPSGDTSNSAGQSYYQIVSSDHGKTWSKPTNLTDAISGCSKKDSWPRMEAGNRIQTSTGRLLWGGETTSGPCFWYSDDGGATYNTTRAHVGKPNEFSLVETSNGVIIMNSRKGDGCSQTNHRREYRSTDNGLTWTGPTCSPLLDAVNQHNHGCEASIINAKGKLLFLNPSGSGKGARTHMKVHCSLDNGKTWPSSYAVTSTSDGGYSDLIYMPDKSKNAVMLGFNSGDNNNIVTVHIGTSWCGSELYKRDDVEVDYSSDADSSYPLL